MAAQKRPDSSHDVLCNHLHCSQRNVAQTLDLAQRTLGAWAKDTNSVRHHRMAIEALGQLQFAIDQHFSRLAGEGMLEQAVERNPKLYAELRRIETEQCELCDQLRTIIERLRNSNGNSRSANPIIESFQSFVSALQKEVTDENILAVVGN
ncbi:MAG: hypothetical protein KDB03_13820 [Planctomycetales bacterium]|nr:hypothetical protein [Planctomycetales bacterium]